jgi:hypothetical protein
MPLEMSSQQPWTIFGGSLNPKIAYSEETRTIPDTVPPKQSCILQPILVPKAIPGLPIRISSKKLVGGAHEQTTYEIVPF